MSAFKVIIVSGLSGSGKSCAIKALEDMGYFCVDNLPTALIPKFVELCAHSDRGIQMAALGIDIREVEFFGNFTALCDELKAAGHDIEVLFLESSDEALVRRFSETRRPHPLSRGGPLVEAIRLERELMEEIKKKADRVLDTTNISVHQLRESVLKLYHPKTAGSRLTVSVLSFGFKYGAPYDADLVFDVRFLPNPNFVPELKELTGQDPKVREYVKGKEETQGFLARLSSLLDYLLPLYEKEGKSYLTIAVGCTGGRHRSVAVAESLKESLGSMGADILVRHRDIDK